MLRSQLCTCDKCVARRREAAARRFEQATNPATRPMTGVSHGKLVAKRVCPSCGAPLDHGECVYCGWEIPTN